MQAEDIKRKAKELGAAVCGIGDPELLRGEDPQRNPFSILLRRRVSSASASGYPAAFIASWRSIDSIIIIRIWCEIH